MRRTETGRTEHVLLAGRAERLRALPRAWRRWGLGLLVAATAAAVALGAFAGLPPLAALEGGLTDRLQAAARPAAPAQHPGVSVVAITEVTLARLPYRSPVDRGLLADLLDAIRDAGVRSVAFDILFDQPTEPEKDLRLIEAIRDFPAPVVVAWGDARAGLTQEQQTWLEAFIEASGAERGAAGLVFDGDGIVRSHAPVDPVSGARSLPAAAVGSQASEPEIINWLSRTSDGKEPFQVLPAHGIPLMAGQPAVLRGWLEGRVVLIGADLPQQDRHRTALSADPEAPASLPGVVVHAHVTAQLLDGRMITGLGGAGVLAVALAAGLLGAATGFSGRPFWQQALAGLVLLATWLGAAFHAIRAEDLLLPVGPVAATFVLAFAAAGSLDALRNRREKRFIRNAFAHYVAPQLVDALTAAPERLKLGGERRCLSFLFTDIAGFTSMSEKLAAADLATLLNAYLDGMSRIVLDHGGTLDKFIGDAVVALFGAPVDQADHARRAIECALALDVFAEDFRRRHTAEGLGATRIGVHSGEATVGNFGGDRRFDYTAMGDAMNTAARLEGANKSFGTRVAISATAIELAGPEGLPALRPVGKVILKGKKVPVAVFAPLDGLQSEDVACYISAMEALDAAPDEAQRQFAELGRRYPADPLIALHLGRLAAGERGATFELKEK